MGQTHQRKGKASALGPSVGTVQNSAGPQVDGILSNALDSRRSPAPPSSGGQPLPQPLQVSMSQALRTDLSSVRVHVGPTAPAIGALAFTQGSNIHFAPGQYVPDSTSGRKLLGHELAHVLQQRQGRVQPTTQIGGLPVNDEAGLEAEADRIGSIAAASPQPSVQRMATTDAQQDTLTPGSTGPALQLTKGKKPTHKSIKAAGSSSAKHRPTYDPTYGNLFQSVGSFPFAGRHRQTQKHSKRDTQESEHVVPMGAFKLAGIEANRNSELAISMPYSMHQGATGGDGGGVSSTGSSETAQAWRQLLADSLQSSNWYETVERAVNDEINSMLSRVLNGDMALDPGLGSALCTFIDGYVSLGRLTSDEAGRLKNMVTDRIYKLIELTPVVTNMKSSPKPPGPPSPPPPGTGAAPVS